MRNSKQETKGPSRRSFLKKATAVSITALNSPGAVEGERIKVDAVAAPTLPTGQASSGKKFIAIQVGWHIWHNNSFSPFFRAEQDYAKLRQTSDYLKVVIYNNCGGPRLQQYLKNVHSTIFRDAKPEEALALHYRILGYGDEANFDKLPVAGLSSDYVARETKRAVVGVRGEIPIYPGIDIDIPTEKDEKKTQPADVRAAMKAAFTAGAAGVILSRKYSEMKLANLAAAGEALKELGIS